VHARDPSAAAFYERHGFEQSPTDPPHRILLMTALRASLDDRHRRPAAACRAAAIGAG
jgi:hypothetical protein